MSRAEPDRLEYVDGLRAVAVLAVVAFHSSLSNAVMAHAAGVLPFILKQGCHGVDLFFVVSGFCLSYPVLKRVYEQGVYRFDVRGYVARRLVRIVPPYYAALAAVVALYVVLRANHIALPEAMSVPGAFRIENIVAQMLFLDAGRFYANTSFWTLFVEFRWYFVFPVLLWVWVRSPKAFALIGVALLACFLFTQVNGIDVAMLPAFMLGILAAHLRLRPHRAMGYAPVLALVAVAAGVTQTPEREWYGYFSFPTEIAAFAIVVSAGALDGARRLLSGAALQAVGRSSYGIYLVHGPVVGIVNGYLANRVPAAILIPLAACAGILCGFVFSYAFEQPFLRGPLRRRAIDLVYSTMERVWKSMPGENGIVLRYRGALRAGEALDAQRSVEETPSVRTFASARVTTGTVH